jgi:hypothetical protein
MHAIILHHAAPSIVTSLYPFSTQSSPSHTIFSSRIAGKGPLTAGGLAMAEPPPFGVGRFGAGDPVN